MKKIPVFPFTIQNKGGNSAEKIPASESRSDYNFVKETTWCCGDFNESIGRQLLARSHVIAKKKLIRPEYK